MSVDKNVKVVLNAKINEDRPSEQLTPFDKESVQIDITEENTRYLNRRSSVWGVISIATIVWSAASLALLGMKIAAHLATGAMMSLAIASIGVALVLGLGVLAVMNFYQLGKIPVTSISGVEMTLPRYKVPNEWTAYINLKVKIENGQVVESTHLEPKAAVSTQEKTSKVPEPIILSSMKAQSESDRSDEDKYAQGHGLSLRV